MDKGNPKVILKSPFAQSLKLLWIQPQTGNPNPLVS
jgi:hypothetical protein